MTRAFLLAGIIFIPACAARVPPATPAAPALLLNHTLPDDARLCVPRETFRNEGIACITVGELRALLRRRRSAAFEVGS